MKIKKVVIYAIEGPNGGTFDKIGQARKYIAARKIKDAINMQLPDAEVVVDNLDLIEDTLDVFKRYDLEGKKTVDTLVAMLNITVMSASIVMNKFDLIEDIIVKAESITVVEG